MGAGFQEQIYSLLEEYLMEQAGTHGVSAEVIQDISAYSLAVAQSIANDTHNELIEQLKVVSESQRDLNDKVDTLSSSLSSFMENFVTWVVVPTDGGAALKVICVSDAGQIVQGCSQVQTGLASVSDMLEDLEELVTEYTDSVD